MLGRNDWRRSKREWRQADWERSLARERLDRALDNIGERKATPTEAINLVTLALRAFAEGAVERKLVGVLWKFVGQ